MAIAKTYVGKRVTDKNKVAYFYNYADGTCKGTLVNPNRAIGEQIDENDNVVGMASDEDIATWTSVELRNINEYNRERASKRRMKDNEIMNFIAYMKSLKLSKWEKMAIFNEIKDSI